MFKKRNKILLIDDATELAESLSMLFETHDYEVTLAHNGKQGLKRLEGFEPDLIILDMDMPIMGGIEFYHTLLEQNNGKSPYPVLVFTGRESLGDVFKDLAVDGFMTKPFDFDTLVTKVNQIFAHHYGKADHETKQAATPSIVNETKIIIFESNQDLLDDFILAFSSTNIALVSGIPKKTMSYEDLEKEMLSAISSSNAQALILRIPSLNPLHEDYLLIRKILKTAKTNGLPTILYLDEKEKFSEAISEEMLGQYSVCKVLHTTNPQNLIKAVSEVLKN
jgi:DNA-binding response OmpR family regulator